MKIKIIDLLNNIADGEEVPKKIIYKGKQWKFYNDCKDYENDELDWLFDGYVIPDILNDEVEILETTVYTNGFTKIAEISKSKENEMYIVERVDENGNIIMSKSEYKPTITYKQDKIEKLYAQFDFKTGRSLVPDNETLMIKINEIINVLNEKCQK